MPEVDFSFSPSLCEQTTIFTDLTEPGLGATIESWQWDFGDPFSGGDNFSSLQNPSHSYPPIDSAYLVELIVTNSHGCVDTLQQIMQKGLCMQAIFEVASETVCYNNPVCFTDSSYILGDGYNITRWRWDFGDGNTTELYAPVDSVCHTYSGYGNFKVTLIVSTQAFGKTFADTSYRMVYVSPMPVAKMAVQAPCAGASTAFTDLSSGSGTQITRWSWDFGVEGFNNDTSSLQNPLFVYTEPGEYNVQLIATNQYGCQDTTVQQIEVFQRPVADFSFSLACQGDITGFTDQSEPAQAELSSWLWIFGNGQTAAYQQAVTVYSDTGTFVAEMIVTDQNSCADTASHLITVHPVPISDFLLQDSYQNIQGQILLENLSQQAIRYEWDLGNGDTSQMFSPVVRYEDNGTYLIQLVAFNDQNCPDTSMIEYVLVFQGLYVPTGFTPGADDPALKLFKPVGLNLESYELVIINQRGNIVFRSKKLTYQGSPAEGWDGKTNGVDQPSGTYMWRISAKFRDGSVWTGNEIGDGNENTFGKVVLIR